MDTKSRGVKNIIFGILAQVITIGFGILIPRLVLVNLGSEANGLLSSVGTFLTYMSLLEAGVGTATLQALYAPIDKDDRAAINKIMAATDHFYKRTGAIYLAIILVMSFAYTFAVKTTLPRIDVFLVIIFSGLSGVLNYFFQGKFKIFLSAEGKSYITTNVTTFVSVGSSLTKVALLLAGFNVVAIQVSYFILNLIQMAIIVIYMHRHYKWMDLSVDPDYDAISQKNAVLVHQISGMIFSNTDVIILTVLSSLKTVSVYSMYAMIFGMVKSVAVVLSDSYVYALGQSYTDKPRFMRMFNTYEIFNMAITFSLFGIAGILITPFLKLYTAGVNDINYIDMYLPILFVSYYLLHNARASSLCVINIAQEFENTKWRSVLESVINLTVSIALTYKLGIYGVLLGTIAALLYRTNDMIIYAAHILKRSPLITYRRWIRDILLLLIVVFVTSRFNFDLGSYWKLMIYGIVLCITVIPLFMVVNALREKEYAKYAWTIFNNMFLSKFKKKVKG